MKIIQEFNNMNELMVRAEFGDFYNSMLGMLRFYQIFINFLLLLIVTIIYRFCQGYIWMFRVPQAANVYCNLVLKTVSYLLR